MFPNFRQDLENIFLVNEDKKDELLTKFDSLSAVKKWEVIQADNEVDKLKKIQNGGSRKVSPVGPGINMRVKRAPKKKTRKVKAKAKRGTRKL